MSPDNVKFELAWQAYPRRKGGNPRANAFRSWSARLKEGVDPQEMLDGVRKYAAHCESENKVNTPYVLMASTFFGPAHRWRDFLDGTTPEDEVMSDISSVWDGK
jgi:hypothetical protein